MLTNALQGILNGLSGLLTNIVSLLPASPFQGAMSLALENQYLRWLAWIVPWPQIVSLLTAWGVSVGAFYLVMIVLRWAKAIE